MRNTQKPDRAVELALVAINAYRPSRQHVAAVADIIRQYGAEVRKAAAEIVRARSSERHGWDKHDDAETLDRMPLP